MSDSKMGLSKSEFWGWVAAGMYNPEQILAVIKTSRHKQSSLFGSKIMNGIPQTELERTILSVWQEVLNIDQVGVHDNFFDLGGHSVLMVQVINKLRHRLQNEILMLDMIQYPTVHTLAAYLSQGQEGVSLEHENETRNKELKRGRGRLKQRRQQSRRLD